MLLHEKPYQRELTQAAETLMLVRGNVCYLSADLLIFLTELLKPHIDANEKAAEIYKKYFRNVRDIPPPTVFQVKKHGFAPYSSYCEERRRHRLHTKTH